MRGEKPTGLLALQYRLATEYNAESRLEPRPWTVARWWREKPGVPAKETVWPTGSAHATDPDGGRILLVEEAWQLNYFAERNPHVELSNVPFEPQRTTPATR